MYSRRSGLILGFHGCDKSVVDKIILGEDELNQSVNSYDWLGNGTYFWDYSYSRALDFAKELKEKPNKSKNKKPITNPDAIGAVIDLGFCLDLLDYKNIGIIKETYSLYCDTIEDYNNIPKNKPLNSSKDLLNRFLDCAVIEFLHTIRNVSGLPPFDSVRGVFWEGGYIYPDAGFKEKNHIQICIRNPNCIKGYFKPRTLNPKFINV